MSATPVLELDDLAVSYRSNGVVTDIVEGVSFTLGAGEVLGLAGESGSGKSTVARAAMGWLAANAFVPKGDVRFLGRSLLALPRAELRGLWGRELAYIPQEVSSGLNPSRRIGAQLTEVLALHTSVPASQRMEVAADALKAVGIDVKGGALQRYPFEFSGGQQQRITIAMATLCKPKVLILDEPTTGIDATLRRETLAVLRQLLDDTGMAAIYISHDLAEVADISGRLGIFYAGRLMELGPAADVFEHPHHPYTRALRRSVATLRADRLVTGIVGTPPGTLIRDRCSFFDRCPHAEEICHKPIPFVAAGDRRLRCVRPEAMDAPLAGSQLPAVPEAPPRHDVLLSASSIACGYGHAGPMVLQDISFDVLAGELVGLVGESGSGKSTMLRAIAGLHPPSGGTIAYEGAALAPHWRDRSLEQRRRVQLVFQNPERSLNPRRTIGQIIDDAVALFEPQSPTTRRETVQTLLERVRLPAALTFRYPHQLSGGEKQRVAIARAFAASPRLLLCDEIVSALDVSVQAVVMRLIRDYVADTGAAAIFVSHDLPVVRMMSAKVLVLDKGIVCEAGPTEQVFGSPRHRYTQTLLASLPRFVATGNFAPTEPHQLHD